MELIESKRFKKQFKKYYQILELQQDYLYKNGKQVGIIDENKIYTYSNTNIITNDFLKVITQTDEPSVWKVKSGHINIIDFDKNNLIGITLFNYIIVYLVTKAEFIKYSRFLKTKRTPYIENRVENLKESLLEKRKFINVIKYNNKNLYEYICYLYNIGVRQNDLKIPKGYLY